MNMPRHKHDTYAPDAGQVIVMFAVGMLFFVSLIVVIGDNALVRWQARNLQNTTDAAALAGAQELNGTAASEAPARAAAQEWANKNIDDASYVIEVLDNYTKIRVTATKNAGTLFGGALTLGDPNVTRSAAARIASIDLLPCVVPLGIQKSFYEESLGGGRVALRPPLQNEESGANTGMLNLEPGNLRDPIANGSCNTLTDPVTTDPGWAGGDVNAGFRQRALNAWNNSPQCYTEQQVRDNWDHCKPGFYPGESQATTIMLMPVLQADFNQSGSHQVPLETTENGQTLLAYFWFDAAYTYPNHSKTSINPPWDCQTSQGQGQSCVIYGKFLEDLPVDLAVWQGGDVTDFDPEALIKIVQLVE